MATTERTTTNGTTSSHDTRGANENKFLSFCLGSEHYGVEILRVREIIGLLAITRSEERRVGKECLTQCRSRWSPYH